MGEYSQIAIAGLFVALLIGARTVLAGRFPGVRLLSSRKTEIEVSDRVIVAPNQSVAVVRWRGREFLLASSTTGFAVLAEESVGRGHGASTN